MHVIFKLILIFRFALNISTFLLEKKNGSEGHMEEWISVSKYSRFVHLDSCKTTAHTNNNKANNWSCNEQREREIETRENKKSCARYTVYTLCEM